LVFLRVDMRRGLRRRVLKFRAEREAKRGIW